MKKDRDVQRMIRTAMCLPLCGCGNAEKMRAIIRDVLERGAQPREGKPSFYDPMPEHELSGTAVEFVAQVLSHADYLEHGGSVGYSWLTLKGDLVLRFLRKYGVDQGGLSEPIWPEWSFSCDPTKEEFESTGDELRELRLGGPDDEIEIP